MEWPHIHTTGRKGFVLRSRRHRTTWASFRTSTWKTNRRSSILGGRGGQEASGHTHREVCHNMRPRLFAWRPTQILQVSQSHLMRQAHGHGHDPRLLLRLPNRSPSPLKQLQGPERRRQRAHAHDHHCSDEDDGQPRIIHPHELYPHSDDCFKVSRESSHIFNIALRSPSQLSKRRRKLGRRCLVVPAELVNGLHWGWKKMNCFRKMISKCSACVTRATYQPFIILLPTSKERNLIYHHRIASLYYCSESRWS